MYHRMVFCVVVPCRLRDDRSSKISIPSTLCFSLIGRTSCSLPYKRYQSPSESLQLPYEPNWGGKKMEGTPSPDTLKNTTQCKNPENRHMKSTLKVWELTLYHMTFIEFWKVWIVSLKKKWKEDKNVTLKFYSMKSYFILF